MGISRLEIGRSPSYYGVLGLNPNASDHQIRRAYRNLAKQWHPDKWTRTPRRLIEAKHKFQQIQEAYSVLSDRRKRLLYDTGLYDKNDDEAEGFADFVEEMASLVNEAKKEKESYSLTELQRMFCEMIQSFETSNWEIPQSFHQSNQDSYGLFGSLDAAAMNSQPAVI